MQIRLARTAHAHDERIQTNPGEFGQKRMNPNPGEFGRNRAKTGEFGQKMGKKRANETETWQNRAKPKVSPKLYWVSGIPGADHAKLCADIDANHACAKIS